MNIIVATHSGHFLTRPDTTWKLNLEKIYLPEGVSSVSWTPVLFAHISRPGKGVEARYAGRYFDTVGYGVLLYPENWIGASEEGFACASCVDATSILPAPLHSVDALGHGLFRLTADGRPLFERDGVPSAVLEEAVAGASSYILMRTGDFLAVELQPRRMLLPGQGSVRLQGNFCGNETFDKTIIL